MRDPTVLELPTKVLCEAMALIPAPLLSTELAWEQMLQLQYNFPQLGMRVLSCY